MTDFLMIVIPLTILGTWILSSLISVIIMDFKFDGFGIIVIMDIILFLMVLVGLIVSEFALFYNYNELFAHFVDVNF